METPSKTTIGVITSNKFKDLEIKLKRAMVEQALPRLVKGIELYGLVDKKDIRLEDIPPFLDPIKVDDVWVLDLRGLGNKVLVSGSQYILPDDGPIGLLKRTTFATMQWENNPSTFSSMGNFGVICFGFWVGNIISNTEGLSLVDRNRLIVASMFWGWTQKNIIDRKPEESLSASEEESAVTVISGNVGIERGEIMTIVRTLGHITDIYSFITAIKKLQINRIKNMASGTLITIVGNSWFGFTDNKHMLAIALEYPPYFYAIVYEAIVNPRLYKRTNIAGIVENQRNNHTLRSFKASFKDLVSSLDDE